MQGWTPDFIPKLAEDAGTRICRRLVPVSGADALRCSPELAQKEGIFTGISGGATLAGALRSARRRPRAATVLCMLPDTGERYLSTPLFEEIPKEMTAEETEISRSTPSYRFDAPPPAPTTRAERQPVESPQRPGASSTARSAVPSSRW